MRAASREHLRLEREELEMLIEHAVRAGVLGALEEFERRGWKAEWLTPEEVARLARCDVETVRRAYRAGELRFRQAKRGGRVLISRQEANKWLRKFESKART